MLSVARVHSIRTVNVYLFPLYLFFQRSLLLNRGNRIFSIHFILEYIYISLFVRTISFDWSIKWRRGDGIFTRVVKMDDNPSSATKNGGNEWEHIWWGWSGRKGIVFSRNNYKKEIFAVRLKEKLSRIWNC